MSGLADVIFQSSIGMLIFISSSIATDLQLVLGRVRTILALGYWVLPNILQYWVVLGIGQYLY